MQDRIELIRQFIDKHKISETALANLAGISQPTLHRNLNGTHKLSLKNYEKLKLAMWQLTVNNTNSNYDNESSDPEMMYLSENYKGYNKTKDDYLELIKNQEQTIKKLIEQNEKLADIIQKLIVK